MSRRTPHFSKSFSQASNAFALDEDGPDTNADATALAPASAPFCDFISDFIDKPLQEPDPLLDASTLESVQDNDGREDCEELSVSHSALIVPSSHDTSIARSASADTDIRNRDGRRRLVSSRPTSRVARRIQRNCPEFQATRSRRIVAIRTGELLDLAEEWFSWTLDGGQSSRTVELRRMQISRLLWFLHHAEYEVCGTKQIRHFFRHLQDGHTLPQGRWGEGAANRGRRELRPATLATYDRHLRSFFKFLVTGRFLSASPMDDVPRQKDTADQVEPYNLEQIKVYVRSAQNSKFPKRNEAIVRFLLDTGVRASELCGLRMGQVDLFGRRARVLGKGNRNRIVSWGRKTGMVLRAYVREEYFSDGQHKPDDPLFITATGKNAGEALTYTGLRLLIRKLGKRGGIQVTRCSPHTFRHTFAIWFLRRGGEFSALRMMLGHNSDKATQIYVKYAQADIENQHRAYSPGDMLDI